MTFSHSSLLRSMPGLLIMLIGISTMADDIRSGVLIVILGAMMSPVVWSVIESKLKLKTTWRHKLLICSIMLIVFPLIIPQGHVDGNGMMVQSSQSNAQLHTEREAQREVAIPPAATGAESTSGSEGQDRTSDVRSTNAHVLSVVDGDTVKVRMNGTSETIRVIGINTPETVHPSKPVECFGAAASRQAKAVLSGKDVDIVIDQSQQARDTYGRVLAYVMLPDGKDFGQLMIEGGYAYEYTYDVPYEKQVLYKEAQAKARDAQVGLWAEGACSESVARSSDVVAGPVISAGEGVCTIKGNVSADGEKIYHVSGQQYYSRTVIDESAGERWFCTEAEAEGAGWRKAKR